MKSLSKILVAVWLLGAVDANAQIKTAWIKPVEAVASNSTVSTPGYTGKAEFSIDNNPKTKWTHKGQATIRFDLGRVLKIRGIEIQFTGSTTGKWPASVEVEGISVLNLEQIKGVHYFAPRYGRFISIKSSPQSGSGWCEIGECNVYIEFADNDSNKPKQPKLNIAKSIHLLFKTEKGLTYQLQVSKDLKQWSDFRPQIMGSGDDYEIFFKVDDFTGTYYRVTAL